MARTTPYYDDWGNQWVHNHDDDLYYLRHRSRDGREQGVTAPSVGLTREQAEGSFSRLHWGYAAPEQPEQEVPDGNTSA